MKLTRRTFLQSTAMAGAGLAVSLKYSLQSANAAVLSPNLRKWVQPLRGLGPSGIPVAQGMPDAGFPGTTLFQITAGEFEDQLHPDLPPTKLWGYWDTTNPVPRHLGGVIISKKVRLRVFASPTRFPRGIFCLSMSQFPERNWRTTAS